MDIMFTTQKRAAEPYNLSDYCAETKNDSAI